MRKVKFKKWIPIEQTEDEKGNKIRVPHTGCWETGFSLTGLFHQWGLGMEDTGENVASYTIGLIEDKNGVIHEMIPTHIVFETES